MDTILKEISARERDIPHSIHKHIMALTSSLSFPPTVILLKKYLPRKTFTTSTISMITAISTMKINFYIIQDPSSLNTALPLAVSLAIYSKTILA